MWDTLTPLENNPENTWDHSLLSETVHRLNHINTVQHLHEELCVIDLHQLMCLIWSDAARTDQYDGACRTSGG